MGAELYPVTVRNYHLFFSNSDAIRGLVKWGGGARQ